MANHHATDAVSRRNVLKTAGGLLAGSTMLAGLGAAETEEGLRFEVKDLTEEYIAVRVRMSEELYERVNERGAFPDRVFLGLADQFVIREDSVSLPEETEGLARPVEMDFENPHDMTMHFRIPDSKVADFIGQDYIEMGLGIFPERTIPRQHGTFDTEGLQPGTY